MPESYRTSGPRRARLPRVLATSTGLAALGIGSSVAGSVLVAVLLVLQGLPHRIGRYAPLLGGFAAGYVALAVVLGSAWTTVAQHRTVVWFARGCRPDEQEARRALRLPADLARISGVLWSGGTVLLGVLTSFLGSWWDGVVVALTIALGGLTTTSFAYLLAERVVRPVLAQALKVASPRDELSVTVLLRLVLSWVLASGVPLLGVLLVVLLPTTPGQRMGVSLVLLAAGGLLLGAVATALFARTVAFPLRRLRASLRRVELGDTSVEVDVEDGSEIGLLQSAVNDMVRGLREQDRMRDLFGRHVGTEVARQALERGAAMSGEVREVTALFVDVVDSTLLAHRLPPTEVAGTLNRFFACVVDAVSANNGLVNKFQGDAALCIFGAPTPLTDSASAALRTARRIRDAIREREELDLGIGVATGAVFAGHLGSSERMEYTVIGDAVNEAARLTESAKRVDGRILASEVVVNAARLAAGGGDGEFRHWVSGGAIPLRGWETPVSVWVDVSHGDELSDVAPS